MATMCFRPPPLPPNKKSLLATMSTARKKQPSCQPQLSSTYLSFRDPSDDVVEPSQAQRKRMRRISHTNSLNRGRGVAGRPGLVRCHSEGHLDQKGTDDPLPMSISRYMRALSGSWKNLLNCKCDVAQKLHYLTDDI